jgi:hypothetical protein
MTVFNGMLYFSANANDGKGTELYRSTGRPPAWQRTSTRGGRFSPLEPDRVRRRVVLQRGRGRGGLRVVEVRRDDRQRVGDLNTSGGSFPAHPEIYNNSVYFQADGGDGAGKELWRYRP